MATIDYTDKVTGQPAPVGFGSAADFNEIKSVVNANEAAGSVKLLSDDETLVSRRQYSSLDNVTHTLPTCLGGEVITITPADDLTATGVTLDAPAGGTVDGGASYLWNENKLIILKGTGVNTWVKFLPPTSGGSVVNYGAIARQESKGAPITAYWQLDTVPANWLNNTAAFTISMQLFSYSHVDDENIPLIASSGTSMSVRPDGSYFYFNTSIVSITYDSHLRTDDVIHFVHDGSTLDIYINDTLVKENYNYTFSSSRAEAFLRAEPVENYTYNSGGILRQVAYSDQALTPSEIGEITRMVTDWTTTSGYSKYGHHWKPTKTGISDTIASNDCTEVKGANDVIEYVSIGEPFASPPVLSDGGLTVNNDTTGDFDLTSVLSNPDNASTTYAKVSGAAHFGAPNPTTGILTVDANGQSAGDQTAVYSVTDGVNVSEMTLTATITAFQIVLSEDWESGIGSWTAVDDPASVNQWEVGTATAESGTQSAYVSDDGGTTNTYTTNDAAVSHLWIDVAIGGGVTFAQLDFDWKGVGEGNYDYLRVFIAPTSETPTGGTEINFAYNIIGASGKYSSAFAWTSETVDVTSLATAGATVRLILQWKNDTSGGSQPPAAIDNIVLVTD